MLDDAGQLKWGIYLPGGGRGGAPTVADFDGDGRPDIGVAGAFRYVVFKSDGRILWQSVIQDNSSNVTGSSVFDFDGDGQNEVVYADEQYLRIYKGATGQILYSTPNSSATAVEYPIIVDVDRDNRAEIVITSNDYYPPSLINGQGFHGIRVFEDANDTWVNTRKIWNQHTYHITNANDDGTIPRREENSWEKYNTFRCNSMLPEQALASADITTSYITADQSGYPAAVILSARIGNGGAIDQPSAVDIAFYDGDPQAGGVLIGTTTTTGTIKPGVYQDVSISWSSPTAGSHSIYVVADKDSSLHECRTDNNIASAAIDIGAGQPPVPQLQPDLEISQGDVTIIPASTIEGQPATVTAVVHNVGTAGASEVAVSFYDGDPQSGGALIGSVTKAGIEAGQTAYAEVLWSTFGQSGRNYIHVVVDPGNLIAELNEANNATLIPVDVTPPALPDLAVTSSDISFSNLNPGEGEILRITATIRNLGTDMGGMGVTLYDGDPAAGGTALASQSISQIIPFGGTTAVSFDLDTLGLAGERRFYIAADPDNAIDEGNETNNSAWSGIAIGPSELVQLVTTDKATYTADENTVITITLTNLKAVDRQGSLDVKVIDGLGNLVATVTAGQPLSLLSGETKTVTLTWNTATTLSGGYKVHSRFTEPGGTASRAEAGITISAQKVISAGIITDRISYGPNQPVTLTSTITSQSSNYIFADLAATITISSPDGQGLFTDTRTIPILLPGQMEELKTYWNTGTYPPGAYPVTLEVKDASGTLIASSSTTVTISGEIKPSKLLKGTISVDRQHILQGDPVTISYTVTNAGNMDLPDINLSVLTVHVVNQSVYDTMTDHASLTMGQTFNGSQLLQTSPYTAKDYLVVLRANIGGTEETLAGTFIRVEGAPSAPSLNSPESGSDLETLSPALTINNASDPNDDQLTYEFELYSDGGLSGLVVSSGLLPEGSPTSAWQVPMTLAENATYYWRARAFDGLLYSDWMAPAGFRVNVENDPPAAPTLSAPADSSSVDTLTPVLAVTNASDPDSTNLTYNFEIGLDAGFTQPASSVIGVFEGTGTTTSWTVDIPLQENTWYYWRAQADDWLITGPWMAAGRFFVNTTNEAPSAPMILSPAQGSSIASPAADIAAVNSIDPDSAGLTYLFELDTAASFDTPALMTSGSMSEGQGSTLWHVEGLQDNTWYFVRVKGSDGQAESPWSDAVSFFVNTANDVPTEPVLSNPSDGGAVSVATPTLVVHNSADMDGDALTYDFELYADTAMTNLLANAAGVLETPQVTSWPVPLTLTENSTYHWRARVYDGQAYGGWMPLASFFVNTANDVPGAPILYAPAQGSTIQTLTPALSVYNSTDPDSDVLTYDFEVYDQGTLVKAVTGVPADPSGITSIAANLSDNTTYNWLARAYDGDRYSGWMDTATFSIHMPVTNITATINFDPDTLNKKSSGTWVTVYIELPSGHDVADIDVPSLRLEGTIPAETWPYAIGDQDHDGIRDLMAKFRRSDVINILSNGDNVTVHLAGKAGTITFEGVDTIRVIK